MQFDSIVIGVNVEISSLSRISRDAVSLISKISHLLAIHHVLHSQTVLIDWWIVENCIRSLLSL